MTASIMLCVVGGLAVAAHGQLDVRVYDVGAPAQSGGVWASSGVNVYDDVTFGGLAAQGPVQVSKLSVLTIVPATAPPDGQHLYARLRFYPDHDSTVGSGALPYSGTPVTAVADLGTQGGPPPPFPAPPDLFDYQVTALLDESNVFNGGPQDRTAGLKIELFYDAAMTQPAEGWQLARRANFPNQTSGRLEFPVGSSDYFGWFSGVGPILSADITNSQRSGGTETNNRATYVVLYASYSCGGADFDGDGDAGTDADIEAFFACLSGDCCATCWPGGSDFDTDGDSGTDADIEAFFRVLAGGSC